MRKYRVVSANVLFIIIIGLCVGCTGALFKDMGRFEPSDAATGNYEKFVVHEDYNYFIGGSDVYPLMIFGIKKEWLIDSDKDLWKKIDPDQKMMAELVANMQRRLRECCIQNPHGFDILDHHGRKIGEGYSMLGLITGIRVKEEGKVVIYPPIDNDDVKRYQDRGTDRSW
jgi:hypothetical protein